MKQSSVLKIKLKHNNENSFHIVSRTHNRFAGGEILYYGADDDGYIPIDLLVEADAKAFAHYVLTDQKVFDTYIDWKVRNDRISVEDHECIGDFFIYMQFEV